VPFDSGALALHFFGERVGEASNGVKDAREGRWSAEVRSRGAFLMRGWRTRGMTRIHLHVSFLARLPHITIHSISSASLSHNDGVHVAPSVAAPEQRTHS
jgi:hypothetical protein